MKSRFLIIVIILILSLPSIFPLFHSGFFQTDDGEWMVIRFSSFYQALADGQFPVRWLGSLNYEFGYPVASFLYPGFMYLGVPIKFIGFGFVDTIKIILGISMIGSAIFSYFWLRRFFTIFAAIIGALLYLYAPYHLYDIYVRGSVGEILALAIAPFILWQVERRSIFWGSLSLGFLILAHNSLALLFLLLIFLYMVLDIYVTAKNKRQLVYKHTIILMLGAGLAAFFWIPAIYDLQYTVFSQIKISEWQKYFASYRLIGIHTFIILLLVLFFFLMKREASKHRMTLMLFFVGIITLFASFSISYSLWNILPVSFLQFPFRLLSIMIICTAFLGAFLVNSFTEKKRYILGAIIFFLLVFSALPYLKPGVFFDKGEGFYATNMDTTTVKNEYMPKWVKDHPISRPENKVVADGVEVSNVIAKTNKIQFTAQTDEESKITVNTIYFPGWRAVVDSQEVKIDYGNKQGTIRFSIPEGSHGVSVYFSETSLRLSSDIISLVSIVILLVLTFFKAPRRGLGKLK